MPDFPSNLPRPLLSNYSVSTETGVTVVRFDGGNTRLRRRTARHRHTFILSFIFTTQQLWAWQSWANREGYDWHNMPLQSPYAGLSGSSTQVIPHSIRYTSDITYEAVSMGLIRVSVAAELDATTIPQATVAASGTAIVAGTPSSPAESTTSGGTPSSTA